MSTKQPMYRGVAIAYLAMCGVTAAATVLPVPVYAHMMVLAMGAIYVGSYNSTKMEKEESEQLETKDAYMFPFIGSAVLFSLYLVFKFLPREYVNLVIKAYFFLFGVLALGQRFAQVLGVLLPASTADSLDANPYSFKFPAIPEIPLINPPVDGETEEEKEKKRTVEFSNLDALGVFFSSLVGAAYLTYNDWITSNIFGVAFSIKGIESLGLGSYFNGLVLLCGLFIYDIFWVFGTDVMVTVAKSFDAPIKLIFPKPEGGKPSILGLGDIVIPGIFIALMLRFDIEQQKKCGKTVDPVYFKWVMVSYWLGLSITVGVMYFFEAAQPALLYLVPAVLGSTMLLGLLRGEHSLLVGYSEEVEKDDKKEDDKSK